VRLAYVVDVHDRFEAVPTVLAALEPVDVLLVGGDITTGGSVADAERAVAAWSGLVPRLLAVAGNMDSRAIDDRLGDLGVSIDGRGVVLGDVGVFGVSAAPVSPLRTPYELDEAELRRRVERGFEEVRACRVKVFCPHAPPAGTSCDRLGSGRHVGSSAVRELVEREQPDLVLCGHIHEARGMDSIGRSRIVNPGPAAAGHYALVEIDGELDVRLD
jgi:uncharacterized protein